MQKWKEKVAKGFLTVMIRKNEYIYYLFLLTSIFLFIIVLTLIFTNSSIYVLIFERNKKLYKV